MSGVYSHNYLDKMTFRRTLSLPHKTEDMRKANIAQPPEVKAQTDKMTFTRTLSLPNKTEEMKRANIVQPLEVPQPVPPAPPRSPDYIRKKFEGIRATCPDCTSIDDYE